MTKFSIVAAGLVAATAVSARAQNPVQSPGTMPKPTVAAEKPSSSGPTGANEAKGPSSQAAAPVQEKAENGVQAAEQNKSNQPANQAQQNTTQRENQPTQQNQIREQQAQQQRQLQQNPGQLNPNVQPGQAQLQQNGRLQDRDTNRSTFTQDRNNSSNPGDRNQQFSRDDRNQQASGRQHSAMRPNDLRAPDIGLWFDRECGMA